jgi:hypothetical protein
MTMTTITMRLIDLRWHGRELPPDVLRRQGLQGALRSEVGLRAGDRRDAEKQGRAALRALADAFLSDREANVDLFRRAHQLGRTLSESVGCPCTPGKNEYTLECPIYGLHRLFAHSLAMTITTACSICGGGALACLHVPGEQYDGRRCVQEVTGIARLGHVAMTANPDFIYTWHQPNSVKTETLIADGTIAATGDPAYCTHCQECSGEPSEGDLDPVTRLNRLTAEGLASQSSSVGQQ